MSVFHHQILVEFAETDAAGVVHFSNYLRYMERIEHAFWRSLGQSVITTATDSHISFPRVRAECEYMSPAHFEETIDATLVVERIGDKSITFAISFSRAGEPVAAGRMVAVCCKVVPMRSMEPISIPDFIRVPLLGFVGQTPS